MTDSTMADRHAIERACFDYAAANDDRDIDTIVSCFTAAGSFGLQVVGQEPMGPFVGAAAIREFYGGTLGAQDDQRRHVVTNVRIDGQTAGSARVRSYFTLLVTDGSGTRVATTGVYTDVLERSPDGRWQISSKWLDLDGMF